MSTHRCPGGCGRNVRNVMFACYDCWGALPKPLQTDIYGTAHLPLTQSRRRAAIASAVAFYERRAAGADGWAIPPEWAAVRVD